MTKMLDIARSRGPCGVSCQHVVACTAAGVPRSAGSTREMRQAASDVALNPNDAPTVKMNEVGHLKTLRLYRVLVDLEIGRASEYGARWWSRRLVEVCEEAGLVRLGKQEEREVTRHV